MAARRSAPGYGGYGQNDKSDMQEYQVGIFKETSARTIAVEGQDTFEVDPDIIHLSFKVADSDPKFTTGLKNVLSLVAEARGVLLALGVPPNQVYTDSVSSRKVEIEMKKNQTVVKFDCSVMIRVVLQDTAISSGAANETSTAASTSSADTATSQPTNTCHLFPTIMLHMLTLGVTLHAAPTYELQDLTSCRNEARVAAVENAKEKAGLMVDASNAIEGGRVTLGAPVTITDVHVDLDDDADDSFGGSGDYSMYRDMVAPKSATNAAADAEEDEHRGKRARLDLAELEVSADQLFQVSKVTVSACVSIIFSLTVANEDTSAEVLASAPAI